MTDHPNPQEAQAAFRLLAKSLHPDRGGTDETLRALLTMRNAVASAADWDANDMADFDPQAEVDAEVDADEDDDNFEPLVQDGISFPRVASNRIRNMPAAERASWDADRLRCKLDPLELSNVLNFDMQPNPHRALFAEIALPMQNPAPDFSKLDETIKKRMVLWPRGTHKTSAVMVAIVQTILNYADVRILFLTGSDDLARRQLKRVRLLFEHPTERFKYLFPEFIFVSRQKKSGAWVDIQNPMGTAHEFTVPCRPSTVFA